MVIRNTSMKMMAIIISLSLMYSMLFVIKPSNPNLYTASAESTWTQTSDTDFESGTLDNVTTVGTGEDAELRIDTSKLKEWTKKTPANSPGIRHSHTMASIYGKNKVVLFGGSNGGNETWIYDVSDNVWTEKTPKNSPSSRLDSGMAAIYETDNVLLFGGQSSGTPLDETWIYNSSSNSWTQKLYTIRPVAGYNHIMSPIYGTDKVLLFGGCTDDWDRFYKTWIFDMSENKWTDMDPSSRPSPRTYGAMASIDRTKKVVLFGGYDGSIDDETWVYDLESNRWNRVYPGPVPIRRDNHAMATIYGTDMVMLFGGRDYFGTLNDVWIFDLSDNTWTEKKPITKPSARREHGMASVYGTDQVVLFGGLNNNWVELSDTWVYKHFLYTSNGTFISAPYDTGSKSNFKTLDWNGIIPPDTSILFQLRTAANSEGLATNSFVGPEGKTSTYYSSSVSTIWSGHNGDRWVQYKCYFNIHTFADTPSLHDVSIFFNCLPNTLLSGPPNDSLIKKNNPTFSWTFNDVDSTDQMAFQVLIDDDSNFENVSYDSGEQQSANHQWEFPSGTSYSKLPERTWYWKVRTKDNDGDWGEYSQPWVFTIDSRPPSSAPTIPVDNGFYNGLESIIGIASDGLEGSDILKVEIMIKRLSDNYYWNDNSWVPLKTWLVAEGTTEWAYDSSGVPWATGTRYNIQSRATDYAYNIEPLPTDYIFTMDLDNPESTIDMPMDESWANNFETITGSSWDIEGAGIEKVEICINCINTNYYWNGQSWDTDACWINATGIDQWTYDITCIQWEENNQYIIYSRAIDIAGNVEFPATRNIFRFDGQLPEFTSIDINNGGEYTSSTEVTLTLQAEDIGSGVSKMAFSIDGTEWLAWESFNKTRSIELPEGEGEKLVYFKVQDLAGNIAGPIFDTITLDTTPPEELSIVINDNDEYSNSEIIILNLNAKDSLSGLKDMAFSTDGTTWSEWEPFKPIKELTIPPGDGEKTIHWKVMDEVDNIAITTNTVTLDTTPPHSLWILINDGVYETKTTSVNLKLNAVDDLSEVYRMSFGNDGASWSPWENYSNKKSYTLPAGDGKKIVYFKVKDHASNVAEPVGTIIHLKTSSEEGGSAIGNLSSSVLIGIVITIILIIVLIIFGLVRKRKKAAEPPSEKPGAPEIKQGPAGVVPGPAPTPGQAQRPSSSTLPQPQTPPGSQMPQTKKIPQLPPARVQAQTQAQIHVTMPKPKVEGTTQAPTQTTPQPTTATQTQQQTPVTPQYLPVTQKQIPRF